MHIALCDDNVADRKQFERLIKREADRRNTAGENLFADSFGNAAPLLSNPMQYDVFYIDLCKTPGTTGADVAASLRKKGVTAPIVMCCSETDYRKLDLPENVFFLDKPIRAEELSASLDRALDFADRTEPLIELRVEEKTHYLAEAQLLYAFGVGKKLHVRLTDGQTLILLDNAQNLFSQIERFPSFFSPTRNVVLNGRHMRKISFGRAKMSDGKAFRIARRCMPYAKKLLQQFAPSD